MPLTVQELAAFVGGQFASDARAEQIITGAASVEEAAPGDVTFFGNPKYLGALKVSRATAALVPLGFKETIAPIAISVENPSLAFSKVAEKFGPEPVQFEPGVHPRAVIGRDVRLGEGASIQPCAVVEDGAQIGPRTVIGAHCYVGHGSQIGADCQISAHVTINARCIIGSRVVLHSGVVIGSDGFGFTFSEGRHVKIPQTGIVQIDDDVEVGANTTVDRARFGRTWIGAGTKIDNLVQIAHNVVIGKHCIIVAQSALAGSCRIGDYVTVAGQSAIVGHVEVGDRVTIAARSGVTKNVEPDQVIWGAPAMPINEAKAQMASVRRLPALFARMKRVEQVLDSRQAPSTEKSSSADS